MGLPPGLGVLVHVEEAADLRAALQRHVGEVADVVVAAVPRRDAQDLLVESGLVVGEVDRDRPDPRRDAG
jgi:hypothetical protein